MLRTFHALTGAILNALNSKGLRHALQSVVLDDDGNIECPEFKGIKTVLHLSDLSAVPQY